MRTRRIWIEVMKWHVILALFTYLQGLRASAFCTPTRQNTSGWPKLSVRKIRLLCLLSWIIKRHPSFAHAFLVVLVTWIPVAYSNWTLLMGSTHYISLIFIILSIDLGYIVTCRIWDATWFPWNVAASRPLGLLNIYSETDIIFLEACRTSLSA